MDDAIDAALRALRHRDRTTAELDRRLQASGVGEREREEALATLARTGLVDDRRYAGARAASLAQRGAGDALIRHDLLRIGLEEEDVADALATLEPERARARRIVAARGRSTKTARYLTGRGFADDVVTAVIAEAGGEELG